MAKKMLQYGPLNAEVSVDVACDDPDKDSYRQTHNCVDTKTNAPGGVLHKVSQKLYCDGCNTEVPRDQITSALEFAKGKYVEVTKAAKDSVKVATSGLIVINEIVPESAALEDPRMLEGSVHYLVPVKNSKYPATGYVAILEMLRGDCAIARTEDYGREYTVLIRIVNDCMVMHRLHYPGELRAVPQLALPTMDPSQLALVRQLKDLKRVKVPSFNYVDSYHEAKAKMHQNLINGVQITAPTPAPAPVATIDIKAQLEAMLAAAGKPAPAKVPETAVAEQPAPAKTGRKKKVA